MFYISELPDTTPGKQIECYLDLAMGARKEAARAPAAARQSYLRIAEQWEDLAIDTRAKLERDEYEGR